MKNLFYPFVVLCCLFPLVKPSIASAQNLILNSSFEIWLDSMGVRMPFGWYTSEASDSGSAVRTTDAHSGIYALKLTGSDTMAYASTITYCQVGRNYYFSGWAKSTAFIAGSFIITWLKLSQEPVTDPVIIPIFRRTSYYNHTRIVQAPDSAIMVNINVVAFPGVTIYVDDVTLRDTVLVGVEENHYPLSADHSSLKVYPNPAQNHLTIRLPQSANCTEIKIFDGTGQIVKVEKFKGLKEQRISLDGIKSGIYFLRAIVNNKEVIEKFIVQR